jgi:hypothetical protein
MSSVSLCDDPAIEPANLTFACDAARKGTGVTMKAVSRIADYHDLNLKPVESGQ